MKTLKVFELNLIPYGTVQEYLHTSEYPEYTKYFEYTVAPADHEEQMKLDRWLIDQGAEPFETILIQMP